MTIASEPGANVKRCAGQATVLHSSGGCATHQITREPKVPTDGSWGSGSTGPLGGGRCAHPSSVLVRI